MTDASSDGESVEENLSQIRKVHKLLHSSSKSKPRRKKKMPPELKIIPAQTSDSPYHSDYEKKVSKSIRPRSVSMFNEAIEKPKLKPASWHRFRGLPPPKHISDVKNKNTQPTELQVKLNSLKRNVWSGMPSEEKGPLSWGISSFAMNSYFTDSEALLRSCSQKLEELKGERKKSKEEKKKKKIKKNHLKVPNVAENVIDPLNKLKSSKKKGKFKHSKSENSPYMNNPSFTDIPIKNVTSLIQKTSPNEGKQAKSRFRKGAIVTTAIQSKKNGNKMNHLITSENSDSEDSSQFMKNIKKKTKMSKPNLRKHRI
ncbi:unnamed protein product [Diatraea saccharalis]|uniref:Uncharacterized protein n=1 Tax=Diatraea saccharalis TaxID=40085 RepID=A0A9P0G0D4_9NEOP|nr:unnamed protein product [Diatraea saccharalis]